MPFLTQYGLFKLVTMQMGITNAPAIFKKTMNNLFMDMLEKRVVVFLDDVLIYSNIVEQLFELLRKVFTYLYKHAFYLKD